MSREKKQSFIELGSLLVILVAINIIASFLFTRVDFTSEKRYSLSKASKEMARSLDDIMYVRVYLEGDFPAGFKRLKNATREMLDEFRAYSGGRLQYDFVDPLKDKDAKTQQDVIQQLVNQGLQPTNLQIRGEQESSQKIIFPGAILTYKGREIPISLLQTQSNAGPQEALNKSIQALEFQIANSMKRITTVFKKELAVVQGHAELDSLQMKDWMSSMQEFYNIEYLDITNLPNSTLADAVKILQKFDVLVIAKPKYRFEEKEKFILDQYVMNGGKILWMVESLDAHLDSLDENGTTLALPYELNLEDQFFKYGVRVNPNLVLDLNCSVIPITYSGNTQLFPWLFYPILMAKDEHPITQNIDGVRGEFSNGIDVVKSENLKFTTLLSSSKYTKLLPAPVRIALGMAAMEPNSEQFTDGRVPVAVLVEGNFPSVFENRLTPESESKLKPLASSVATKQIFISDGNIGENFISKKDNSIYPLGYDRFSQQTFANKEFLLNCVDYLCDDTGLLSIRNKEIKIRVLDSGRVKSEKVFWQVLNLVLPVFLILLVGLAYNFRRKRQYAK